MIIENFKDDKDAAVKADQIFVNHNFGDFAVRLGRQPITFGNQGGWLYGDGKGYDGAQLSYNGSNCLLYTSPSPRDCS